MSKALTYEEVEKMLKRRFTVVQVMASRPCYTNKKIQKIFDGRKTMGIDDVLSLDIHNCDKRWFLDACIFRGSNSSEIAARACTDIDADDHMDYCIRDTTPELYAQYIVFALLGGL